jgi:hypothetical protein
MQAEEGQQPDASKLLSAFQAKTAVSRRNSITPDSAQLVQFAAQRSNTVNDQPISESDEEKVADGPHYLKSLELALKGLLLQYFPFWEQDVIEGQWMHPLATLYISDVEESFDISAYLNYISQPIRRSFSFTHGRVPRLRRANRRHHLRSNSYGCFERLLEVNAKPKRHIRQLKVGTPKMQKCTDLIMTGETQQPVTNPFNAEVKLLLAELQVQSGSVDAESLKKKQTTQKKEIVRVRFDDIFKELEDEHELGKTDVDNTWFSLRDVMELLLLQTQQAYVLDYTHE